MIGTISARRASVRRSTFVPATRPRWPSVLTPAGSAHPPTRGDTCRECGRTEQYCVQNRDPVLLQYHRDRIRFADVELRPAGGPPIRLLQRLQDENDPAPHHDDGSLWFVLLVEPRLQKLAQQCVVHVVMDHHKDASQVGAALRRALHHRPVHPGPLGEFHGQFRRRRKVFNAGVVLDVRVACTALTPRVRRSVRTAIHSVCNGRSIGAAGHRSGWLKGDSTRRCSSRGFRATQSSTDGPAWIHNRCGMRSTRTATSIATGAQCRAGSYAAP